MHHVTPQWIMKHFEAGAGNRAGLAAAMGVRRDVVSKILSGTRKIKADELPAIENYFASLTTTSKTTDGAEPEGIAPADVISRLGSAEPSASPEAWRRLMAQLSQLSDEELDYLSVAAEVLVARRTRGGER